MGARTPLPSAWLAPHHSHAAARLGSLFPPVARRVVWRARGFLLLCAAILAAALGIRLALLARQPVAQRVAPPVASPRDTPLSPSEPSPFETPLPSPYAPSLEAPRAAAPGAQKPPAYPLMELPPSDLPPTDTAPESPAKETPSPAPAATATPTPPQPESNTTPLAPKSETPAPPAPAPIPVPAPPEPLGESPAPPKVETPTLAPKPPPAKLRAHTRPRVTHPARHARPERSTPGVSAQTPHRATPRAFKANATPEIHAPAHKKWNLPPALRPTVRAPMSPAMATPNLPPT